MAVIPSLEGGIELVCFSCGASHDPYRLQTVCAECGLPLRVDLALPRGAPGDMIDPSVDSMWRYAAVGPVPFDSRVSLGEGWTPVHQVRPNVFVKDEALNPTGSFKDRGMSMAVSAARLLGAGRIVAPSAGNAAVALSAYGRAAGTEVLVAMPDDTPESIVARCRGFGAEVHLVDGDISIAGKWLAANRAVDDFDVSTLKEPYRVEGKKTMGYELWEQFDGELPDYIIYPTGGGTGLVGMWKAFEEMEAMGWIDSSRPRLVSVQSDGCAPIVEAYQQGKSDISPWPNPQTTAWGLRVPFPIAGFICLRAIAQTQGRAMAIEEEAIHETARRASAETGIDFSPEGGASWAAMEELIASGVAGPADRVLVWNTGSGAAYR